MGASLRELHPAVRPLAEAFVKAVEDADIAVTITSVVRSRADQERLYERARAGLQHYPVAHPGESLHECGLAWDMVLDPPEYTTVGEVWESLGFRWGGRFRDRVHFDFLPTGTSYRHRPKCGDLLQ